MPAFFEPPPGLDFVSKSSAPSWLGLRISALRGWLRDPRAAGWFVLLLAAFLALRKPWSEQRPHVLLAWTVVLLVLFHSMLEYPLWYGPFVMVTATSGCNWGVTNSIPWVTITSGQSGTGNGTVNYTVAANTAITSRTGTITIDDKTFTVTVSKVYLPPTLSPVADISIAGTNGAQTSTANYTTVRLFNGWMQCSSCHNPHMSSGIGTVITSNYGRRCVACHKK